jgi:hypothetical protein
MINLYHAQEYTALARNNFFLKQKDNFSNSEITITNAHYSVIEQASLNRELQVSL